MKRTTFFIFLTTIITCSILLISCNNVDLVNFSRDIKIDESLVIPVGEENLTIKDVFTKFGLPNNVDTVNREITFHWSFRNELLLNTLNLADSIFPFDKTIYPSPFPITYPPFVPIDLPAYYSNFNLSVNTVGSKDRVDSVFVNSSLLNVQVDLSSDLEAQIQAKDLTVEFVFPDDKLHIDNNITPTFTPVAYGKSGQIAIGKYSLRLNGASVIPFTINFYIKPQNTPITILPTSQVFLKMNFLNIDFSVAYGFFNLLFNEQKDQPMPIRIEDYLPDAFFRFSNPNTELTAISNVGADLKVKIDYLKVYNSATPTNFIYTWFNNHTTNSLSQTVPGPLLLGDSAKTKFQTFDNRNGELDHIFDNKPYPNMINYKFSVINNASRIKNFVTPSSSVKIDVKTTIPLKLKNGSNYFFKDTIQNLNLDTLMEYADSAVLVLKLKNGLPTKARFRMTFWKSTLANDTISALNGPTSVIKESTTPGDLFSIYEINSPKVDSLGNVTGITPQSINIVLDRNQISVLKQTKSIIYSLAFEAGVTIVGGVEKPNALHFTTDNTFGVKLGVFIKGNKVINIGKANN